MDSLINQYGLSAGSTIQVYGVAINKYGESKCSYQQGAFGPKVINYNQTYNTNFSLSGQT